MSALGRATITALVPTFNEEHNIAECLSCLTWVDQIIVVDSFSTDRTVEIAKRFTDEVYQHEYVNSAAQKNWAMANLPIRGDWTLIVDADERVVPELAEEIQRVLEAKPPACVGYFINRRNYFCGKWIRGCGWYPSYNLRLFRTGRGRYEDREVDADLVLDGDVGYLQHDMLHYTYPTISDFLRKLDRYTSWEAIQRSRGEPEVLPATGTRAESLGRRFRRTARRVCPPSFRPVLAFLNMYIWERGLADGRHGLVLSQLYAFQELLVNAKMWEAKISTNRLSTPNPQADQE
jgi:glycosyltransferase involved in cell wall biosynthesis